jgi:hypothetical protein
MVSMGKMKKYLLLLAILCFVLGGCPLEAPPVTEEEPPVTGVGTEMDPRLVGVWRFGMASFYEECVISEEARFGPEDNDGNIPIGSLVFGGVWGGYIGDGSDYGIHFGGDIVYAESFGTSEKTKESAGILILRLWDDYPVTWRWWSEMPRNWEAQGYRYPDRNYYGIYYLNFKEDGNQVFLAQTNDQKTNYGPTETRTLEEAKKKFTRDNINILLNLDVGDPQRRYDGTPGFKGLDSLK